MYRLEDDEETSSRLKKRDFAQAEAQTDTPGDGVEIAKNDQVEGEQTGAAPLLTARFSASQISSSIKKLVTPDNTDASNRKVALAALTVACIGVFFTALDQTVVVTALPQIITDLQIPITQLPHAAWIISAYLLGFVVAMPLMGRVSDIYGRRRIFLLCLMIFGGGSIMCGLAPVLGAAINLSFLNALQIDTSSPGLVWLIAARLIQAVGGGALVPLAMAVAGDFYGQERRGLALGIIGAMTEAGGALGPLYGAIIVQHLGWQYIFYLNVPLVIGLIVAAWILIPRGKRLHERIDWLGAGLLALALTCLSLGLAQQGTTLGTVAPNSQTPQNNPIALTLAVLFLAAFVLVERKVRWPVVDLSVFKRFTFSASSLVSLLVGGALIIAMADIPIYVDTVLQGQVLDSGLALLRLTALIPVGAMLGGWLCSRVTCRVTGVLGLLFTAAGFFLMSRWPIHVDWLQMTISTMTAGFGFGLVIAPISTTAINAVRTTQAGMSSAVVTALRMVGMMLGLAMLTSWALAYFKQLVSTYPSLPITATSAQFATWSQGYAAHIIQSAHSVYCSVFFISMVLCLIAIIPAIFLWGNRPAVAESEVVLAVSGSSIYDMPTSPVTEAVSVLEKDLAGVPPVPPRNRVSMKDWKWWRDRKRRKLVLVIAGLGLILLLVGGGLLAAFTSGGNSSTNANSAGLGSTGAVGAATPTAVAGPRMIQLALDKGALTSIFVSQLNLQQGGLTDLNVTPTAGDGLILNLNLHIDANGLHRVMPIELDGVIGIDQQQNLQLHVTHLKRDGLDAGATAASNMQAAVNQMLASAVMPALRNQLKGVKLVSAHTSTSIGCSKNVEMLVLQIEAPPIQGIAAQPTPIPFCFNGPVDLNKLLPH